MFIMNWRSGRSILLFLPDSLGGASFWLVDFLTTATSLDSALLDGIFFSGLKHAKQLIFPQLTHTDESTDLVVLRMAARGESFICSLLPPCAKDLLSRLSIVVRALCAENVTPVRKCGQMG